MALFHTNVLDPQIKALPTVSTASGSVSSFDTDMTENLIEVVCDIQYQQASGTPTPQDEKPITTYTSLNLSHSGADTSNPNVKNIPFGQTVAKATLNVTTGVLTINKAFWTKNSSTMDNAEAYPGWRNAGIAQYFGTNISREITNAVSSIGQYYSINTTSNQDVLFLSRTRYNLNQSEWIALAVDVQIVIDLENPIIVQLSATQITALLNENNIWCDTGDTEVKYLLTVGKAIS